MYNLHWTNEHEEICKMKSNLYWRSVPFNRLFQIRCLKCYNLTESIKYTVYYIEYSYENWSTLFSKKGKFKPGVYIFSKNQFSSGPPPPTLFENYLVFRVYSIGKTIDF